MASATAVRQQFHWDSQNTCSHHGASHSRRLASSGQLNRACLQAKCSECSAVVEPIGGAELWRQRARQGTSVTMIVRVGQAIGDENLTRSRLRHTVRLSETKCGSWPSAPIESRCESTARIPRQRLARRRKGEGREKAGCTQRQQQARWADEGCLSRSRNGIRHSQWTERRWIACAWLSPLRF